MSRGPHVRELFIGHDANFEPEDNQSKKKSKSKGKEKSQLGAYKPKILSHDPSQNIPVLLSNKPVEADKPEGKINKAFIIGDKDVPMTLEASENIYSEILETAPLTSSNSKQTTSNPIFSDSPISPTEPITEVIDGIVIPPPDYEEEEVTVDFDTDGDVELRRRSVYTEFVGEDFSRYLSDDEEFYEFDQPRYSVSSSSPIARKVKKSKTEAWRKQKKDSSKHMFRQNSKTAGKSTLRNFSVSDSKLGLSVDGKENKMSMRDGVPSETSYEAFLQARTGTPHPYTVDSSSNDSGHETGDDVIRGRQGTFWKKLTLKFKKTGYSLKQ